MHLAWQELGLLKNVPKLTLGGTALLAMCELFLPYSGAAGLSVFGRGPLIVASASKEPTFGTTVSLGQ